MSRRGAMIDGYDLAWGLDYPFGYFFQVFKDDEEEPIIDIDQTKFSRPAIAEEMKAWNVPQKHIDAILSDVDFPEDQ